MYGSLDFRISYTLFLQPITYVEKHHVGWIN